MFKRKLGLFLTIIIFTCTYAYGGTFHYSGIPFSNIAVDADMPIWDVSGKWVWVSSNEFAAAMSATGADSITTTAGFGASINADDLVVTGTVLELQPEILHSDAAGAVTGRWTQVYQAGAPQPSEPGDVAIGDIVTADNNNWDPLSHPHATNDYRVLCTGTGPFTGVLLDDIAGVVYASSVATPTLIAATLNDTSDPHTLIQAEMESKYISNVSGAMHLDVLADAAGWSVIFMVENAANFVIHPADSQTWYLNGTVLAADRTISNTAATIGESLACISTGTYVFCKSTDADFVSAAE